MNWDNELSSILSVAEGSVAKMRERLTSPGKFSRGTEDFFAVGETIYESNLDPPTLPLQASLLRQPPSSLSPGVQWADLASIQSQLQLQSQVIESLNQKLSEMERERQSQNCHIRTLQEEVHMLREREREREKRHESSWGQTSGAERRMEQWKREIARELSTLRGNITRATSLGNLEESFSSKLCRDELDCLRREVDLLNTRLRRQEEDSLHQQAEARETRRRYEHSRKTLEELTDNYRTHTTKLAKTVSQYSDTKEEVHQIRTVVSELKEEVRNLRAHELASGASPLPLSPSRAVRAEEADSDSEDLSPTPSLAEISSDDLSWLDDGDAALHREPQLQSSVRSRRSDFPASGSAVESDRDDNNDLFDDEVSPDFGSDLSLYDL